MEELIDLQNQCRFSVNMYSLELDEERIEYMKTIVNYSDTGVKYLEIKNMDGKIWLVPFSSVSKGLELYQPSSKKDSF